MIMRKFLLSVCTILFASCTIVASETLPITGSFVNLFYQDVRNKYMNPAHMDNTDPELWKQKVNEMHDMGIEYLVFMAVANEGKADYPSIIMPLNYDSTKKSPVTAIMDEAEKLDMKVFMSIGWAQNQDDNLRIPAILQRQKDIMDELSEIYGSYKSFYGWYLPVEDCLGPVLTESAVKAVNALTEKAHKITPGKKTMISPYGFFCSDFDNPQFGKQIAKLKVDIIAYQDEIGCVREEFPLPRLKENWKKIAKIHQDCGIELWANCESFAWEKGTNDRQSALIPAAMPRILSQMNAASQAGVNRIISFAICGILDSNKGDYWLGQPTIAAETVNNYEAWRKGDRKWKLLETSLKGNMKGTVVNCSHNTLSDGDFGEENPNDSRWITFSKGYNEIIIDIPSKQIAHSLYIRFLSCNKKGINMPDKIYIYEELSNGKYKLLSTRDITQFPNNRHDTWIEGIELSCKNSSCSKLKLAFESTDCKVAIDEIILNPQL